MDKEFIPGRKVAFSTETARPNELTPERSKELYASQSLAALLMIGLVLLAIIVVTLLYSPIVKDKNAKLKRKRIALFGVLGLAIVVLMSIVAIFLLRNTNETDVKKSGTTATHITEGIVTSKKSAAVADAGDYLYVENMLVRTSNRASLHSGSTFDVDTTSIQKGDKVEVKYVYDSDGQATLDCPACYIKKIE